MIKRLLLGFALALAVTQAEAQVFGSNSQTPVQTPTISTTAYASGQSIGGLITLPIFRSGYQPSAIVDQMMVEFNGGETVGLLAFLFRKYPSASTTCANQTALTLANADAQQLVTPPFSLSPSAPVAGATQSFAAQSLALSIKSADIPLQQNLYLCLVVTGAVTPAAATDLSVSMSGVQD